MLTESDAKKAQKAREKKRKQQEKIDDVQLLLQHMLEKEEVTVKLIIDRLYDIGSVNMIDKKFPQKPTNSLIRSMAIMSKPAFRIFAWRWVKKNSPSLITNWLKNKVSFK